METTVYADVLFFVNFSMDFITLWISAILSSKQRSALRMSAAAAIGALYGVLSVIFPPGTFLSVMLCAVVSIIMCITAFGIGDGVFAVLKQSVIIWICGALLGGVMTALLSLGDVQNVTGEEGGGVLSVICAASVVAVYLTVRLICNTKNRRTVKVTAGWHNRYISFTALCDSGNLMRDPVSGDPVIPVSRDILSKLCGTDITESLIRLDANRLSEVGISLRVIPHRSDSSSGIIGGIVPDTVTVTAGKSKKTVRCVLAPRNCKADHYAGCGATVPTSLLP